MFRKPVNRRAFLRSAGLVVATLSPIGAACARSNVRRTLSFEHTHTGESLSVVYFEEGAYRQTSLERINFLLRDFRTDEVHPIDTRTLDILYRAAGTGRSRCPVPGDLWIPVTADQCGTAQSVQRCG